MNVAGSIADDHYLHLTITGSKLKADFQCLHHRPCDAVELINQENEAIPQTEYPIVLEWFKGKENATLRSGLVHLDTNDEDFVDWWYLGDVVDPDVAEDELHNDDEDQKEPAHAVIGSVENGNGYVSFHMACISKHSTSWDSRTMCFGEVMQETGLTLWESFAGEDGTEFRDGQVNIWVETSGYDDEPDFYWDYLPVTPA